MELDLAVCKGCEEFETRLKRDQEKLMLGGKQLEMVSPASAEALSRAPILCFRCGQKAIGQ